VFRDKGRSRQRSGRKSSACLESDAVACGNREFSLPREYKIGGRQDEPNQRRWRKGRKTQGNAYTGEPRRYSIPINGPWCITFEWENGKALRVGLEPYH
jgi:hypothetical protein